MTQESFPGGATAGEAEALIRRGTTAARLGDREEARQAFREATKVAPDNVSAWLGLSGVVGTLTEKRQCFQRVLEIDPTNQEAHEGLEAVEHRLSGRGVESAGFAPAAAPEAAVAQPPTTNEVCYRHPQIETGLRCMQCGRPICGRCSQLTPVGQLCPECRRERRSPNYKVTPLDVVKGFIASIVAGAVGAFLAGLIPFFFLFIFIGPAIGEGVMRLVGWATNKRGRVMQISVALGVLAGAGLTNLFLPVNRINLLIFLVLAISTAVARLR